MPENVLQRYSGTATRHLPILSRILYKPGTATRRIKLRAKSALFQFELVGVKQGRQVLTQVA